MAVRLMSALSWLLLGSLAVPQVWSKPPSGVADPPPIVSEVGDVPAPCFFCEYFVGAIESELEKLPHAAVISELISLCVEAVNNTAVCNATIQFAERLIQEALHTPAEVACKKINLCSAMNELAVKALASFKLSTASGVNNSFLCYMCRGAITQLDTYLWNNQDVEEGQLLQLCQALPQGTEQECVAEIKQRFPALLKLLIGYLDPNVVCNSVNACSTGN